MWFYILKYELAQSFSTIGIIIRTKQLTVGEILQVCALMKMIENLFDEKPFYYLKEDG